jgi:predicted amidohydrolase
MSKKNKYRITHLNRSKIVIAIVQIEGPIPDGMHRSLVGGRNSWVWKSREVVDARARKALAILDSLNSLTEKPDIVVFPEFSIPVEKTLDMLQEKANQYQQIIIGGADAILQPGTNRIYNQSPIILPNRRQPIWATKSELSALEQGLIDEPDSASIPVLSWDVDGHSYWLSVYICLDFRHAKSDTRKGGGIFIVPMCSADVHSFRGWADDALRLENGTATVLCNCVGQGSVGQSGLVAVTPDGKPFKSAFDLPDSKEAIAVFEIDLKQLAPPKKTLPTFKFPLGKRYFYSLLTVSDRVELSRLKVEDREVVTRGVINPSIFEYLGKKMRIAFLSVDNFWEAVDKLKDQDFEVLAILGQHDLLITHLHENRYDLIYDVKQLVSWKTSVSLNFQHNEAIPDDVYHNFPFFHVDRYFKVLGVEIEQHHGSAFHNHRMPSIEERVQLMKLGSDWNDEQIPDSAREKFRKNGWILRTTDARPGEISFIMTISIDHAGPELEAQQTNFETRVMPILVKKKIVTSIYRGRPQSLAINYVLRIWSSLNSLYSLIEEVYKLAADARVSVTTTTYVILKKLSDLSLEKAVLAPMLTAEEANYRNTHIDPRLSKPDRDHLVYLPQDVQHAFIARYQMVAERLAELSDHKWLEEKIEEIERKLAKGLLYEDFVLLKEPHDVLQTRCETLLRACVNDEISDLQLDQWRSSLHIPSQKTKDEFSFLDRIKLASQYLRNSEGDSARLEALIELGSSGPRVRNALTHGEWKKITVDSLIEVLAVYCRFLLHWESENDRPQGLVDIV